ncbi:MAG: hypothetical protein VX075_15710, partial [Pseudomonadota bacterium]|nr:hypothetical protein [Pseudomonadota bacterium]
ENVGKEKEQLDELLQALADAHMEPSQLFGTLAAILHLGDVTFAGDERGCAVDAAGAALSRVAGAAGGALSAFSGDALAAGSKAIEAIAVAAPRELVRTLDDLSRWQSQQNEQLKKALAPLSGALAAGGAAALAGGQQRAARHAAAGHAARRATRRRRRALGRGARPPAVRRRRAQAQAVAAPPAARSRRRRALPARVPHSPPQTGRLPPSPRGSSQSLGVRRCPQRLLRRRRPTTRPTALRTHDPT